MKNYILSSCILFICLGCKKSTSPNPLIGKWQISDYYEMYYNHGVKNEQLSKVNSTNLGLTLEITAKKLIFHSTKGTVNFKIRKVSDKDLSLQELKSFESKNETLKRVCKFELKDAKSQSFYFDYYYNPTKPDIIYGDFWIKGQQYTTVDRPNGGYGYSYTYVMYGKTISTHSDGPAELLGEYKRIQ